MITTAMILAAGRGERMRPLTDATPKPLIPVLGKPLIVYHLERLATAGIRNIVVNHAWLGEQIEETLGDGEHFNLNIQYSREAEALETAGGIVKALPLLNKTITGENPFLVVNGDVYCDVNLWRFCNEPFVGLAKLLLVNNPEHHPYGDFAIGNDRLRAKNSHEASFTFSGIGLYRPEFFKGLEASKQALGPLIRQHMSRDSVAAQLYTGRWSDVGTPARLGQLEQELSV